MQPTDTKSHLDYVSVIGNTHQTTQSYRDRRWNQYFRLAEQTVVRNLLRRHLPLRRSAVFDVGTSYGHWAPFFREVGFTRSYGVELDGKRAAAARQQGYEQVYNCDAQAIPHPAASVDLAISNDVFVHILKWADKVAVVKEMERLVSPGGAVLVNHAMASAFGFGGYTVDDYCSYLNLHEFVDLFRTHTRLTIKDIKPTYYVRRGTAAGLPIRLFRRLIVLPGAVRLLHGVDAWIGRRVALEDSDYVYILATK